LYGLRQANGQWYGKLYAFLISHGYNLSAVGHSLFLKNNYHRRTIVLVYVDDIILVEKNITELEYIIEILDKSFKIKYLGDLTYFLGLEVVTNKTEIHFV